MSCSELTTIEAINTAGTGVRVVFDWRGDRFHHSIYAVESGHVMLIAESIEGDAVNPWPPSPPLQQLHQQQQDNGGDVLFLTGMAGSSHWSGSVSTGIDPHITEIIFDFACRHRTPTDFLGVTYRLAGGIEALSTTKAIRLTAGKAVECKIQTGDSHAIAAFNLEGNLLTLAALAIANVASANTTRWAYTVRASRAE